jgi:hypothetical protein
METSNPRRQVQASTMWDPKIMGPAVWSSFVKLHPALMIKNPVMFVVEVVAALTTIIFLRDLATGGAGLGFTLQIIVWLWFTVLFANFAEAVAEGRGKAQADSLRRTRTESQAKLVGDGDGEPYRMVPGTSLKVGDFVLVEAGDIIPSDGEVIEGVASVNEAAITGESAPVIRESGGDRSAVTGGSLRGRQPVLGLALELRLANEHRDHRGRPGHDVLASHRRGALALADALAMVLERAQQRGAQARLMGAAIGGRTTGSRRRRRSRPPPTPPRHWRCFFAGVADLCANRPFPKLSGHSLQYAVNIWRRPERCAVPSGAGAVSAAVPSSVGRHLETLPDVHCELPASGGRRMSLDR